MKSITALLLAFASCCALADGVPLITPSPAAIQPSPSLQSATNRPEFVKLHSINLNKGAFGASVLTVVIDGKEYRFVGSMSLPPKLPPKAKPYNTVSWGGKEPGGGLIGLAQSPDSAMLGSIFLPPSRYFEILTPRGSSPVLVEFDASITPKVMYPAPAASGVQR